MYIYETHQHTSPCSGCGKLSAAETVARIKERGFAGVILTNHFFHGNTGIDRELPWEEFVAAYEADYLEAKAEGERLGIDVFFGIEEGVGQGKEVLIYGITPQVLSGHPELRELPEAEILAHLSKIVHDAGGVVYQSHPFRARGYIPHPEEELEERYLDGVEGYNVNNGEGEDDKAVAMAQRKGLHVIAGSDDHGGEWQTNFFGIATEERISSDQELLRILREDNYKLYLNEPLTP